VPLTFDFAVRTVAAWIAAMILLPATLTLLIALLRFKGTGEAVPVVALLELGTAPAIVIAFFVALAIPTWIAHHPLGWAMFGLAIFPALGLMLIDNLAGPLGFLVSLPAAALFVCSLRFWPPKANSEFA